MPSKDRAIYIYVLKCPQSGRVRYVGKATDVKSRLRQHISDAKRGLKSHKCDWIRSLLKNGLRPRLDVDRVVQQNECWKSIEQERIAFYKEMGFDLTNGTIGGDGNGPLTEEGRTALSARAKKQFATPQGRKAQSDLMKDLCSNADWRAARDAASKATRASPEYKARMSARSKAKWADPEYREKMRRARAEVCARPEYRAKLSASVSKAQADPDVRKIKAQQVSEIWSRPGERQRRGLAISEAMSRKDRT
ncbi:GIY-YIG nuclease family protein [Sphingobium yanoikuyae]|uniref:GIY-YIG nuclease family protein n=1 Tax=Sphingobium yanoikuyae TaxID=13690 RepID=UPI0035C846AC